MSGSGLRHAQSSVNNISVVIPMTTAFTDETEGKTLERRDRIRERDWRRRATATQRRKWAGEGAERRHDLSMTSQRAGGVMRGGEPRITWSVALPGPQGMSQEPAQMSSTDNNNIYKIKITHVINNGPSISLQNTKTNPQWNDKEEPFENWRLKGLNNHNR